MKKVIMQRPVYLDYNATTPLDPRVLEAMLPFLQGAFGNASSVSHAFGWEASQAVEKARKQVAASIGAQSSEILWTSGATESNNLALFGVFECAWEKLHNTPSAPPPHLLTSMVEHKAILDVAKALEKRGAQVTYLKPNSHGQISAQDVKAALKPNTILVSLMFANNEIGSLNPIAEIGKVTREAGVLFHVDAAQAVGKISIDVKAMNIDLLSGSGHKIYGPKGVGFLYVNRQTTICPTQYGGSQERGLRPGTLNVPGIVGMGLACEIAQKECSAEHDRLTQLRDQFIAQVLNEIPGVLLNGHPTERLANNISFSFQGIEADLIPLALSGLAVSSGSACSSGATSYVLTAIGRTPQVAAASVRIGIGRMTKPQDLQLAFEKIQNLTRKQV
jgi:cysteine desulfurase